MRAAFTFILIAGCITAYSQGTIKVAKPKKDSVYTVRDMVPCGTRSGSFSYNSEIAFSARLNYAFKHNDRFGYEVGMSYWLGFYGELQYSHVEELFRLPEPRYVDNYLMKPEWKVHTGMDFFKLPVLCWIPTPTRKQFRLGLGFAPTILLKVKSDENLIRKSDFHLFNCEFVADLGMAVMNEHAFVGLRYYTSMFPNLIDEGIYDIDGIRRDRQKSRIDLLSAYFYYRIH